MLYHMDKNLQHAPVRLIQLSHTHTRLTALFRDYPSELSGYQKGKTSLDFTEARDSEWQWHQLGYMQVCTSLQTDNHASTPTFSFFKGRMTFLLLNQQHQSTEGTLIPLLMQCIIL